jgi:hypothetical protein
VVCFDGFRGDADGCAGAFLGCGTLPPKAPPWRVGDRRHGSRSIHRPRFRPSCVTDANHESRRRKQRSVAAVTTGQSGNDTALSHAGAKAALGRGASADQHIRAEPYRRNPDLRQSQRLGRRRYRLRFAQCPARQTQKARAAACAPHHRAAAAGDDIHAGVANPPPPNLQPPNTFALGQRPQRLLPILAEPDPYAALGIRAGSFILLPSIDFSGAASTNPEHVPGGPPAAYVVAAPALTVRSDWERHSLTADIAGSWTQYTQDLVPSLNVPYMNSRVDGRIDVTRDTAINLQLRGIINTDNPGSPNTQFGVAQLPINFDVGQTVGITQQFNRLSVSFKGTFDRTTYNPSLLTDGEYSSNADRNFDQYGGIGRIAYELDPGLRPFVQVEGDQRVHDEPFDRNNLQRESVGIAGKVGAAVNMFGSLTGEMAIGYVDRVYKDPTLPNVAGVIGDGALLWQPSALTSAKLSATSQIYETTFNSASGQFSRDLTLEVDHAFRYWLIGILKGGYGNDVYPGSGLQDNRWFASVGAVYKLTREWQLNATVRQDWQIATQPTFTYNATSVLLGVRVQR